MTTTEAGAALAGANATDSARSGAATFRSGGGDVDQQRAASVIGAALEGIRSAIREQKVTYEEFDAFKRWLISVSDTGEWPLFLDVYLEFEVETRRRGRPRTARSAPSSARSGSTGRSSSTHPPPCRCATTSPAPR